MLQRVHRSQTNPNLSEELIFFMLRPLSALSASSCSALLTLSAAPWGLPALGATPQQAANTVLVNGSVYTVNPRQPWA